MSLLGNIARMRWMADYVVQGTGRSIMDAVDNSVWLTTELLWLPLLLLLVNGAPGWRRGLRRLMWLGFGAITTGHPGGAVFRFARTSAFER